MDRKVVMVVRYGERETERQRLAKKTKGGAECCSEQEALSVNEGGGVRSTDKGDGHRAEQRCRVDLGGGESG